MCKANMTLEKHYRNTSKYTKKVVEKTVKSKTGKIKNNTSLIICDSKSKIKFSKLNSAVY